MASGVDRYQAKPIGVRSFLQAVREMLLVTVTAVDAS